MKVGPIVLSGLFIGTLSTKSACGQVNRPPQIRNAFAITFPQNRPVLVRLQASPRLRGAEGFAKIDRESDGTKVAIQLNDLRPAALFGGDYSTYVLWLISDAAGATNLGEFVLNGDRSQLNAWTKLPAFAIVVTAEPHYLVEVPSRFVVLENTANMDGLPITPIQYLGFEGSYNFERVTLEGAKEARGIVRTTLRQAFAALRLAQRSKAPEFARDEFSEAQAALTATVALSEQGADKHALDEQARETVRLAVQAETAARHHAVASNPIR